MAVLITHDIYLVHVLCQIGGGSLRIHKRGIQQKVLEIVGISMEQVSLNNYNSIPMIIYLFHLFYIFPYIQNFSMLATQI